ncbi:2-oxoglutarate dehydrogenase E1 component [bacterium]|nr:2-oxoglutarate dehydrogenase E1 component [bacterium]
MYRLYSQDPALVGETWAGYFERLASTHGSSNLGCVASSQECVAPMQRGGAAQERVYRMVSAFRGRGHFKAAINPLSQGINPLPRVDDIQVDFYRFSDAELNEVYNCSGLALQEEMRLEEIIARLHRVYCGSIGFEFTHLLDQDERLWLQERIETRFEKGYQLNAEQKLHRLQKIIEAEAFESELHRKYVGQKRFSLQGVETVIPMLDTLLEESAIEGVKKVIFGMPHRGRLNVLVNILGKPLEEVFTEFEDQSIHSALGSGDVKYHMGYDSNYTDINGRVLDLYLAPNPSHLEFVNPVVEGIARAHQDFHYDGNRKVVLPVLLHGDAAFAGQGVVFETLNMSLVDGYRTGGTVHLIVNNQIGFTTNPEESRSSVYATDMAKAVQAPIFHVNCEDIEAACWTMKTAIDFRNRYGRDVVVDLYGYRKYGHNEGDDPSFTQPISYAEIKTKKNIAEIYAEELVEEGTVTEEKAKEMRDLFQKRFQTADLSEDGGKQFGELCTVLGRLKDPSPQTGVPLEQLQKIASTLVEYPEDFVPHPKLKKILERRVATLSSDEGIEWGFAENLAFGSLQLDGVAVRLSGQDCGRGTFSQRHLLLSNYEQPGRYYPLQSLEKDGAAPFEVINSTLSEAGVVGFDFGYSTVKSRSLVMWEAQFGDFANGAQVHIDQFISSSEAKWGQRAGLMMLLPHGYEGQGPEHSSARLERYLQLCAEGNMFVCYPSSGAQYFHLLRRQGLLDIKRPVIVMTPKSLLRLKEASSQPKELVKGAFQTIIPEVVSSGKKKKVAFFLSGKVYYDVKKRLEEAADDLKGKAYLLCRLEQLYPFPKEELSQLLEENSIKAAYWVQEEPQNMGAWTFCDGRFRAELDVELEYLGRPESASTATGSAKRHAKEQADIVDSVVKAITG